MKSLRILAAALSPLILPTSNVDAQTRIVLNGGVNFTQIESNSSSRGSTSGFSTGFAAIIPTQRSLEFEFSGTYSRMGRTRSYLGPACSGCLPSGDTIRTATVESENHLGLMALGRVNLPRAANGLRTYVAAGPALSWEVSCHVTRSVLESPHEWLPPGTRTLNCATGRDRLDFGLAGALGLEYRMAEGMGVNFSTLYTHGMRNLRKVEQQRWGLSLRRRAVTVRAGLVYRIG